MIDRISKIPRSRYVKIIENNNNIIIKIINPNANMQTDLANFEALAFMCKVINPNATVTIWFQNNKMWNGKFGNKDSSVNTYLRFLCRIIAFKENYPEWVNISSDNEIEVKRFKEILDNAFKELKVSNNIPNSDASFNAEKGQEHIIENIFSRTKEGSKYLNELYQMNNHGCNLLYVYNQLPNGLFNIYPSQKPSQDTRIFTTGFYDIWAIDNKENLCIFELKKDKGNSHLGIISELFFYAIYAKKILCNKNLIHEKKNKNNYRGYDKLYDLVKTNKIKNVNAFFLLGNEIYPLIDEKSEELKNLMNTNKSGIKFDFIKYDINKIDEISLENL